MVCPRVDKRPNSFYRLCRAVEFSLSTKSPLVYSDYPTGGYSKSFVPFREAPWLVASTFRFLPKPFLYFTVADSASGTGYI